MSPTQPYRLKNGDKCPGNTTVVGSNLGWKTGGMVHAAWKLGMEGIDYKKHWKEQAGIGTLCHARVECDLMGRPIVDEGWFWDWIQHDDKALKKAQEKVENTMLAYLEWKDQAQPEITGSEVPLICECYQYGTTIDYAVRVRGRRYMLEIKTSAAIYEEFWIQMSAQGHAWSCVHPTDPVTGYILLHINKENGGFGHHYRPSLTAGFEAFKALRILHDLKKELK